jgi:hypothetical protein
LPLPRTLALEIRVSTAMAQRPKKYAITQDGCIDGMQ